MINTYDILINPKKIAYDFYEWDKTDEIKHIRKILCFKVNEKIITDFIDNDVKVDNEFLKKFENKTEVFNKREISNITYACILFCDLECVCFLFDKLGKITGRSKLLFDEADDIIINGKNQKEVNINYTIISEIKKNKNYTRKEVDDINEISNYIKMLSDNEKQDELKYLYYECFKKETTFKKMVDEFHKSIANGNFDIINKMNFLLKKINS